jgi:hypothetical protein
MPQGLMPQGGMSGMFGGLRDFLFGPPQKSVSLAETQGGPSQQTLGMAAQSATNIADMYGLSPEQAAQVGQTAAGLVAQGMNITEAITLAANYGAYSARPDMAGSPFGQPAMQGAAPQGMPGLSRNALDLTTPVAPQAAQTFGIQTGGGFAPSDFGGYGGGVAGETGAPGESSFGLDR